MKKSSLARCKSYWAAFFAMVCFLGGFPSLSWAKNEEKISTESASTKAQEDFILSLSNFMYSQAPLELTDGLFRQDFADKLDALISWIPLISCDPLCEWNRLNQLVYFWTQQEEWGKIPTKTKLDLWEALVEKLRNEPKWLYHFGMTLSPSLSSSSRLELTPEEGERLKKLSLLSREILWDNEAIESKYYAILWGIAEPEESDIDKLLSLWRESLPLALEKKILQYLSILGISQPLELDRERLFEAMAHPSPEIRYQAGQVLYTQSPWIKEILDNKLWKKNESPLWRRTFLQILKQIVKNKEHPLHKELSSRYKEEMMEFTKIVSPKKPLA